MRTVFTLCFFVLFACESYGQEKLVSKGKNLQGEEVEYYLQTATVKKVDDHMEAVVKKYDPSSKSSMMMNCKVDCAKKMYMIPKSTQGTNVFVRSDAEWTMIAEGSLLEKVFEVICTY